MWGEIDLQKIESRDLFLKTLSDGHKHMINYNTNTLLSTLKSVKQIKEKWNLSDEELKNTINSHIIKSENIQYVQIEDLVKGLNKVFSNPNNTISKENDDWIKSLINTHYNINLDQSSVWRELANNKFVIDNYLLMRKHNASDTQEISKSMDYVISCLQPYLSHFNIYLLTYKIEDVSWEKKYKGNTPLTTFNVNSENPTNELIFSIINKSIERFLQLEKENNLTSENKFKNEMKDIILFYKLKKDIKKNDKKSHNLKI